MAAAEQAARDRDFDNRTPASNGPTKRMREWEDETVMKQPTDEKRQRMDEHVQRPPSVPQHGHGSPPRSQSSFDAEAHARRAADEQRRANEAYQPSEAAHHPPSLPAIQQAPPTPQPQSLPRMSEVVKEEPRREIMHEPAARRMEVDEDYDDDDDDKRAPPPQALQGLPKGEQPSPVSATGPGAEPPVAAAAA